MKFVIKRIKVAANENQINKWHEISKGIFIVANGYVRQNH